ncbi:MAG: hypothetical protein JXQ85_05145 [Cognatishimia sp.]|uniref:hypothetical protein n=1 Tax=Cognatishimia sp. TaxID=2211648 RepID=UPI003B8DB74C
MVMLMRGIGWFGVFIGGLNAGIKLFGSDEALQAMAGNSRDLDLNITILAFSIIFLALAAILEAVRD